MIRYFAEHPTASNILMILLLVSGLLTISNMEKETFPTIEKYEVQVSVAYPGADAKEIEESICLPLEDATDTISFVEETRCEATDNVGSFVLKMTENGNFEDFVQDIRDAVDAINTLPQESESPIIEELNQTSDVVSIAVSANIDKTQLKQLAETLKSKLVENPMIPKVSIEGFSQRILKVAIAEENLRKYGMSIQDVAGAISNQSVDLPAGELNTDNRYYQIKFFDQRKTPDELSKLIISSSASGAEVTLGELATITDTFETKEEAIEFNGRPAAILKISKNKRDDSLSIYDAVKAFVATENQTLPDGIELIITNDFASIIKDRIQLVLTNSWQGIILVVLSLFLFFNFRYTFWVAMGLPVAFMGSFMFIHALDVSINMISMVGLLIAIGILMDDAIVISESIAAEYKRGLPPLDAAIEGTKKVARGILSSFITTILIFGGLLFLKGDIGQVLKVLPIVLITVISVSLIEAFIILPNHLVHAIQKDHDKTTATFHWKEKFNRLFERLKGKVESLAKCSIEYRYLTIGLTFACLIITLSLVPAGFVKFKAFPEIDGNNIDAKILLPQGTPLARTEEVVSQVITGLKAVDNQLSQQEIAPLVQNYSIKYNENSVADESGSHVATISVDLLSVELRKTTINEVAAKWEENVGAFPDAISVMFKSPTTGPGGQAIQIRLQGNDLSDLSSASYALQTWLGAYEGVSGIRDDLRPGMPQIHIKMQEGTLAKGINANMIAQQLRGAYQGTNVASIQYGDEDYEVHVMLDDSSKNTLTDFDYMSIIHPTTDEAVPLSSIAQIDYSREYAKINRINKKRTVTVYGEVDDKLANTAQILIDTQKNFFPKLKAAYPHLEIGLEGQMKNSKTTGNSFATIFTMGILGIFCLLSFQFKNYLEPIIVLLAIPLSLIGVIWGHILLGLDLSMPSVMGFVSLAGIVVNNSILLVEFVKLHAKTGVAIHEAASNATRDRFRAIFLTTLTTTMGMIPLLFETSMQAQILTPLVTSIVFGLLASTILVLIVLPAFYMILEDFGVTSIEPETTVE